MGGIFLKYKMVEVFDTIIHYWKYLTSQSYRKQEDEKNSQEWIDGHRNTLEGIERRLGHDKKIIDFQYDPEREMGRWE